MTTDYAPTLSTQLSGRYVDFRNGVISGYPLCCVLRYATCRFAHQGARRGGERQWVACGIFHRTTRSPCDWDTYLHPGWEKDRYNGRCVVDLRGAHQGIADRSVAVRARRELATNGAHVNRPLGSAVGSVFARLCALISGVRHDPDLPSGAHEAAGEPTLAGSHLDCSGSGS